jgi:imidazolonepropionase-like amidohydrolase
MSWKARTVKFLSKWTGLAATVVLLLAAQTAGVAQSPAQAAVEVVEKGQFRLHKFEQPIGEESYEISRSGDSLVVKSKFEFTDRGTPVPISATLHAKTDLTPESFEISGRTSRSSQIDSAVDIGAEKVRIREGKEWKEAPRPEQFFTLAGYAPISLQMLLVRYWATHGSPAKLATLPRGEVAIELRGHDEIEVDGKKVALDRYGVAGVIWGRETLWFDSTKQLIAAITDDAEFDHFEAVREGYEPALATFVARAAQDGMAEFAELAKKFKGSKSGLLAVVGATLIDGTGREPIPDSAVVIDEGRILQAGPRARVKIPKSATVIDGHGKTLLPGLWDMHAHYEQVEWGPIYLAAGVTTARDVGNELEFIAAVRDAIRDGRGIGPQLLLAGIVDGDGPSALGVERVNTPEQARLWVDRYHEAGFQQMKIYSSVKLENLAAVAQEAHRLGMTVTGHVPNGVNAFQAVEAGMDQINHIQYVGDIMRKPLPKKANRLQKLQALADADLNSPEAQHAIEFLKQHGTVVDPTLALMEMLFTVGEDRPVTSFEPGVEKVAPELEEQLTHGGPAAALLPLLRQVFAKYVQMVGALHRAGIPVVAGTDQAVPGHSVRREIELYVQAGFTPMEAIQAATIVPARVMKVDKEVGTIEAGKRADMILTQANPLEDIRNIRTVEWVIAGGTLYDCAQLWRSVGFKP